MKNTDDAGLKNYAATAGMHSCKILLARAMASQLGTGANRWAVKIADVSQAFLFADVAEGMNTFVEAPDEYYKLKNLNKENGVKVWRLKKAFFRPSKFPDALAVPVAESPGETGLSSGSEGSGGLRASKRNDAGNPCR